MLKVHPLLSTCMPLSIGAQRQYHHYISLPCRILQSSGGEFIAADPSEMVCLSHCWICHARNVLCGYLPIVCCARCRGNGTNDLLGTHVPERPQGGGAVPLDWVGRHAAPNSLLALPHTGPRLLAGPLRRSLARHCSGRSLQAHIRSMTRLSLQSQAYPVVTCMMMRNRNKQSLVQYNHGGVCKPSDA